VHGGICALSQRYPLLPLVDETWSLQLAYSIDHYVVVTFLEVQMQLRRPWPMVVLLGENWAVCAVAIRKRWVQS